VARTRGPRKDLIDDRAAFEDAASSGRLLAAWSRVRANGGGSGGDGVTLSMFERNVERRIIALSADLRSGAYQPGPLRAVDIPKPAGGVRTLRIPCIRDRVVQTAIHLVLGPGLEAEFEDASFGYRPGRGVADAVARVDRLRREGFEWALDADIDDFFDQIDHDALMARLAQSMTDGPLTSLIALTLAMAAPGGRGLAQGSPLSPLLSNLYLDRLDETLAGGGLRLVRYGDDFVVLARSRRGAEGARRLAERGLREIGLRLDPEKTRVVDFDTGMRFLGHLFVRSMVLKSSRLDGDLADSAQALADLGRAEAAGESARARREREAETRAAAGLAAAFKVLYVREPGRRVDMRNTAFAVRDPGPGGGVYDDLLVLPHQDIDRIELWPGATISEAATRHAMATGTLVAQVNGHGETLGWSAPALAPRADRHLAQAALLLDEARRLDLARRFVDGRIRNQRAALRRWNRKRADAAVAKCAEALNRILRKLPTAANRAELLGREGEAAAQYWRAFARCLEQGFTLASRRAEPAEPAAILLNFASGLLARDVSCALSRAGLHAGFGVLHETADGRDAAVFDLMEEFRAPLCESVVVSAINNRAVALGDFEPRPGGGWRLSRKAGDGLIRTYERQAERVVRHPASGRRGAWRAMMVEQAFALAAHVEGGPPYAPYVMDY